MAMALKAEISISGDHTLEALAALTGKSADAVRAELWGREARPKLKDAMDRVERFAAANAGEIASNLKNPAYLHAMSDTQRDAILSFLRENGYALPEKPEEKKTGKDTAAEIDRIARILEEEMEMNAGDASVALAGRGLLHSLGLGGYANTMLGGMGLGGGSHSRGMRSLDSGPVRAADENEIRTIVANTPGKGTLAGVGQLAHNLSGIAEDGGGNYGGIVRETMGCEGLPWCGGFVRYVFAQMDMSEVYGGMANPNMAINYVEYAKQHGALRDRSHRPAVGDVVYFPTSQGSGHVGVVSKIEGDTVTYVSGNYADMVAERTYSASNPPDLLYADTQAIAKARRIDIAPAKDEPKLASLTAPQGQPSPVPAIAHDPSARTL